MIQALIFDFDGLILDTETPEVQIWQDLYSRYGQQFPLDEWVRTVVGSTVSNLDPVARLEQLTGTSLRPPDPARPGTPHPSGLAGFPAAHARCC